MRATLRRIARSLRRTPSHEQTVEKVRLKAYQDRVEALYEETMVGIIERGYHDLEGDGFTIRMTPDAKGYLVAEVVCPESNTDEGATA